MGISYSDSMLSDESLEEFAEIIVSGFFKSPTISKFGKHKEMAVESFKQMLLANRENVEISMSRFHDWMHKNGVGMSDYKDYRSGDDFGTKGDRKINPSEDDSKGI